MGIRCLLAFCLSASAWAWTPAARETQADPRLHNAFRREPQNDWVFVHLEGDPSTIGFQHGYLLAPEIQDGFRVVKAGLTHDGKKDWAFFRDAAQNVLWPHVDKEYRAELKGIVEGLHARGAEMDLWDLVAYNAWLEMSPYYTNWYDRAHKVPGAAPRPAPEHCSAFVATGSYTKDGRIVIAHNNWTEYKEGSHWNVIFDIVPSAGHRILMDGMPGLIHSGDDFGENSAGIVITETTIGYFDAFDPNGVPEFVRARKAMQYSSSIDDFARIMKDGDNGGYANTWLVADSKNNEIARLELGLKHVTLARTKDGYFVGSNFPIDPALIHDEAPAFPVHDMSISANARHKRWDELMTEYKGKIDMKMAEKFLADHYDTYAKRANSPDERTLCGHIDLSPRGSQPWQPPYGIAGTVQNKATDAAMAAKMELVAAMGHSCGLNFKAASQLKNHPEFDWEKDILRDLDSYPWTKFQAAQ